MSRRCRYCNQPFEPSRGHPQQVVCSRQACQQRRRADSRKQKLAADPEYRQVCRESACKWRADHPDYWRRYRAAHPQSAERNRSRPRWPWSGAARRVSPATSAQAVKGPVTRVVTGVFGVRPASPLAGRSHHHGPRACLLAEDRPDLRQLGTWTTGTRSRGRSRSFSPMTI